MEILTARDAKGKSNKVKKELLEMDSRQGDNATKTQRLIKSESESKSRRE